VLKRGLDIIVSILGLCLIGWIILICIFIARIETKKSGLFRQKRVGRYGKLFEVIKLRSMKDIVGVSTTVTTDHDPRITASGRFFRKTKLDEIPQLINVLKGDMSIVGPRPDVPGYADVLEGNERIILNIRPGITGPASIFYKNEEELLALQDDPEEYNRNVIWPSKVNINMEYIENYRLYKDLYYMFKTVF
jgi:lipopolysaccharide/colanic/teichoic acid biosynthesis glycosyltransferase